MDPAIAWAEQNGDIPWLVVSIGFGAGGLFLYIADKTIPHMHFGPNHEQEGMPSHLKRTILLVFSITLHNIPEGLAVGVAFGAAAEASDPVTASIAAISVALGIGIQNFPEGAAVSIPLRQEGLSRSKAFLYGQASGIVEPIAGVLGALLVTKVTSLLPYALAFAAGAMIYVVVEELIPEAQQTTSSKRHFAVFGTMLGFHDYDDFRCSVGLKKYRRLLSYQNGEQPAVFFLFIEKLITTSRLGTIGQPTDQKYGNEDRDSKTED